MTDGAVASNCLPLFSLANNICPLKEFNSFEFIQRAENILLGKFIEEYAIQKTYSSIKSQYSVDQSL